MCSGITILQCNLFLALGSLIYTAGITAFYVLVSFFLYGNSMLTKAGLLRITNAGAYALVAVSFALLVSNLTSTPPSTIVIGFCMEILFAIAILVLSLVISSYKSQHR